MGKNTSILLGDYFENYVKEKVRTGKYASVSEIVRTVLRLLKAEEQKAKTLINELEVGEKSGKELEACAKPSNLSRMLFYTTLIPYFSSILGK